MNWILLVVVFIVALVLMEMFKHHFTKGLMKYAVIGLFFFMGLLVLSAYVDLGEFFSKDNTFAKTGNVIAEDVSEDAKNIKPGESKFLKSLEDEADKLVGNIIN